MSEFTSWVLTVTADGVGGTIERSQIRKSLGGKIVSQISFEIVDCFPSMCKPPN